MKNMGMVSVIVPVYNVEKHIARCIESIINQTYDYFELILVDDGSKDKSGEICDKYAQEDKRIKVIHKANGGVSSARNDGIDNASGKYITFVDSDDYIDADFLQTGVTKIQGYDAFISGVHETGENIDDIYTITKPGKMTVRELYSACFKDFQQICICGPWCKLFKKSIIDSHHIRFPYDLSLGEDTLFNIEFFAHSALVYFDNNTYYNYVQYNNSLYHKYRKDIYEIHTRVYDRWRAFLFELNVDEETILTFDNYYIEMMMMCIVHIYKGTVDSKERKEIFNKVRNNFVVCEHKYKNRSRGYMLLWLSIKLNVRYAFDVIYKRI